MANRDHQEFLEAGVLLQRLLDLVSHRSPALFRLMADAGVTVQQVVMLSRIEQLGSVSLAQAAHGSQTSLPAASQMIERLVSQRLLRRAEDPSDRRRKAISLTSAAEELLRKLQDERSRQFAVGLGPLNRKQRRKLIELLSQVVVTLGKAHEDGPSRPNSRRQSFSLRRRVK